MNTEQISLKVSDAARACGVSRYVIYDAINKGELPFTDPYENGDRLVLKSDLESWLKRRRRFAASAA